MGDGKETSGVIQGAVSKESEGRLRGYARDARSDFWRVLWSTADFSLAEPRS